jgi:DNA polymerase III delta prime subunit
MTHWKLGCRWGAGKPLFYDWLKDERLVVGVWENEYQVGDLVLLTDGHSGLGIAKVTGPAYSVTDRLELQPEMRRLQIPYEDSLFAAPARIFNLPRPGDLFYTLQQGICRINPHNMTSLVSAMSRYDAEFERKQQMRDVIDLLKAKGQVVLQGPPGTGKTRLAELVADELATAPERRKLIQFHPAYAYEDFVRGISADAVEGALSYRAENKILAELAENAAADPDNDYLLIIDEINRANLPAVLGELIYALENRGKTVESVYALPEKGRTLILPANLYVIGTMNTADRSVGHMDYAIRRRFAFVSVLPDAGVVPAGQARQLFEQTRQLFDDYLSSEFKLHDVQPGHSYFLTTDGVGMTLRQKMEYELKSLLREYLRDGILLPGAEEGINTLSA